MTTPDKPFYVVVGETSSPDPWYWPGNPSWGDVLVALTPIAGAITRAINRRKDRRTAERARSLREEELRRRRTVFVFEQADLFDTDASISLAVRLITNEPPNGTLDDVLNDSSDRGGPGNLDNRISGIAA